MTFSILMADDDLDDQYLVRRAIEDININHVFNTVNNGTQLLDVLLRRPSARISMPGPPDCILLDLNMPMVDGFQTLTLIKSNKDLKDIPVYVLSTSRAERDRERSLELGANAFYIKPTRFNDLKKIMDEICINTEKLKQTKHHYS